MQYVGIVVIPVGWFIFARAYIGRPLGGLVSLLLWALPLATSALLWTDSGLVWAAFEVRGEPTRLEASYGPWFWVHMVYSYALLLGGLLVLVRGLLYRPRRYLAQGVSLALVALAPALANVLHLLDLTTIDLSPFGFLFSAAVLALGMVQFGVLELVPIARNRVVDTIREGVMVVDAKGRILDANPALLRFIGRSAAQTIGQPTEIVFAGRSDLLERYASFTEPRQELMIEGGRFFELHFSPLTRGGRLQAQVVLVRDVSDRVETEAELRRAKEAAEAADRAKGQFLANMSHELRTPLTSIIGFSELLTEELSGPLNAHQREYALNILESGKGLLGLVDSVLDFARLEAGDTTLQPTSFDAAMFLREVAGSVQPRMAARNNRLELELKMPLGALYTDADKLRLSLLHLLDNAAKFAEGGVVTLRAHRTPLEEAEDNGERLVIRISDTGIGIAPEHLPLIFDAFSQVDASSTRLYGGSGLGLTIAKRFCELLGGTLDVQSAYGVGSSFTVRLPLEGDDSTFSFWSDAPD